MARYMVLDLETTTTQMHKRKANPFYGDNWIVAAGWVYQGDSENSYRYFSNPGESREWEIPIPDDVVLLVGFNIKFDLLWLWKHRTLRAFLKRGGKIWCCQYMQYLLEAQQQKWHMSSLNEVAPLYGGTEKVDAVGEMWEAGIDTPDIPKDLLLEYLVGADKQGGDIRNTELVFLGQVKRMRDLKMQKAIPFRMDGLLCTTEMEFNGIKVDIEEAYRRLEVLNGEFALAVQELNSFVPTFPSGAMHMQNSTPMEFNWGSLQHKSALIYGGPIPYRIKRPILSEDGKLQYTKKKIRVPIPETPETLINNQEYDEAYDRYPGQAVIKSGKNKGKGRWKTVDVDGELKQKYMTEVITCTGFVQRPDDTFPKLGGGGEWTLTLTDYNGDAIFATSGEALDYLTTLDVPFCKALQKHTDLNKEIGTYYERVSPTTGERSGMLTCVGDDGIIHHTLNHTTTVTSRLSGTNPNMQNISRGDKSEVKKMFVSRFGEDGMMLELDYSQLEVVGLTLLSMDENMIKDLQAGVDFHCRRVSIMYNIPYEEAVYLCKDPTAPDHELWKARRTACKTFSFRRAYGAGAASIAHGTGMTKEEVEKLIALEDAEYPRVQKFHDSVHDSIVKSAVPFRDVTAGFVMCRRGVWQAPTGTLYSWRSFPKSKRNPITKYLESVDEFSTPQIKNYPTQGTSGELVQMVLGVLFRHFLAYNNFNNKAFLVNTVHDCVWIDVHKSILTGIARDVKAIMESIPDILKESFGMEVPIQFPVEAEAGDNMLELNHLEV